MKKSLLPLLCLLAACDSWTPHEQLEQGAWSETGESMGLVKAYFEWGRSSPWGRPRRNHRLDLRVRREGQDQVFLRETPGQWQPPLYYMECANYFVLTVQFSDRSEIWQVVPNEVRVVSQWFNREDPCSGEQVIPSPDGSMLAKVESGGCPRRDGPQEFELRVRFLAASDLSEVGRMEATVAQARYRFEWNMEGGFVAASQELALEWVRDGGALPVPVPETCGAPATTSSQTRRDGAWLEVQGGQVIVSEPGRMTPFGCGRHEELPEGCTAR